MEKISKSHPIIAYKAFNKDFRCKGFQYKVGKEYHTDVDIRCCSVGFHACESPLEVLYSYRMLASRFAVVEQWGSVDREPHKTKVCSSDIKVVREISLSELISCGIEWLLRTPVGFNGEYMEHSTITSKKESDQIITDGRYTTIYSSGCWSKVKSFGKHSKIISVGIGTEIGSKGDGAKITSSNDYAQIGSDGYCDYISSTGSNANIASDGNNVTISSSGGNANIGSGGVLAKINSSGGFARIYSDGLYSDITSSGYYAKIKSVGDNATIYSSGENAYVDSAGDRAIVICSAPEALARAKKGSWITLTEHKYDDSVALYKVKSVKTEYVDGDRIKEKTWYKLIDGEFVETDYSECD